MSEYASYIQNTLKDSILKSYQLFANEVIEIDAIHLKAVCKILKEECGFKTLMDITALDWSKHPKKEEFKTRFELDYFLYNFEKHERVQLKAFVADADQPKVDSIMEIHSIADWMEREAFDMMGIHFEGHPNLKRLLMWEEFEGHPLRKDYELNHRQPIPVSESELT